jgi:hypothetical protein
VGEAKRIRKLRWLGMQQEAEQLQMALRRVPHTECVIVVPAIPTDPTSRRDSRGDRCRDAAAGPSLMAHRVVSLLRNFNGYQAKQTWQPRPTTAYELRLVVSESSRI